MAIIASASITLADIRDVKATYRYYKLQASTAAAPGKPTSISTLPPSGWSSTEPSYTAGSTNTLYTVDLTTFTDGTFSYSPVSVSSSYEAAKQAFNLAATAQKSADSANTAAGKAQTTADNANTAAGKAQTTADNAQKSAEEASKTATNFLSYSETDGLIISEDASTADGWNTQIKSDGLHIRDGETSVADYGDGIKLYTPPDADGNVTAALTITDAGVNINNGSFTVDSAGNIKGASITGSSMHVIPGKKVEDISGFYAESSDKSHKNGMTAFGMYGTYSNTFQGSTYNGKGMFTPEVITLSYGKSGSAEEHSASVEPGEISTTTTDANGMDTSSSMSGYEIVQAGHGFRGEDLTDSVKGNLGPNATAGNVGSFFSVVRIGQLVICSLNIKMKKNSTSKLGIIYGLPKAAYPANGALSYNGYSSSVNVFIRAGETIIYNDGTIPYDGFVEGQLIYITSE